jgi:hypothetical protein
MNIILDLDGTLINDKVQPRPHLKYFFYFIFQNFQRVSIWTLGNNEWFNRAYSEVLRPLMPVGSYFHFVWCRINHINTLFHGVVKPLNTVYNTFPGMYTEKNTFIVDDTPSTYQENMNNALAITTYRDSPTDTELLRIISIFKR